MSEHNTAGVQADGPDFQNAYFLGAYGENDELLEKILVEFLRDHVFWRRNIHPEDPVSISTLDQYQPGYLRLVARMKKELHRLSADLKRSVPFFNPRYIGHMASDLILPGLLAELITTLYNPNNVTEEAAPVTLRYEMEAATQLARMIGFNTDPDRGPCAWGHLTSGGTIANFEALWYLQAVRFYPLALRSGLREVQAAVTWRDEVLAVAECDDDFALANYSLQQVISLRRAFLDDLAGAGDAGIAKRVVQAIEDERLEALGSATFFRRHEQCAPPVVLVPVTAHYSWKKAMKVLGMGSAQLVQVPVDKQMRMDMIALHALLEEMLAVRRPVLAVVGVLGTTEFGSVDPIDGLVAARSAFRGRGLEFSVHIDAAWGGYLMSMFREMDGSFSSPQQVREGLCYFPSDSTYAAFEALQAVDSVTVDPHKLGYLPFGVGGIILSNGAVPEFVSASAAYVFGEEQDAPVADRASTSQYRHLGKFIMEGSKPGAAAAAVCVAHRVLPLDRQHFGRVIRRTVRVAEYFYERIYLLARTIPDTAKVTVPFLPGTNLVCIAVNPVGNTSAAVMNGFMHRLYSHLTVHPEQPVQDQAFFGSSTVVRRRNLADEDAGKIAGQLGLDPITFTETVRDPARDADGLVLLRHTLMNPWLLDGEDDVNYVDRYCNWLGALIEHELAQHA